MATDYTTYYNLDKYTATDKPNLRDQYNAAMDKVDAALYTANTNANDAKTAVQSKASQSDLDALSQTVSTKASQSDLNAAKALLPSSSFSSSSTVKDAIDGINDKIGSGFSSSNTVRNEINTLSTSVNSKSDKKKILIIGDSFSDVNSFNYCWCANLGSYLNVEIENKAVSGAGFGVGTTFINQLNSATTTADKLDKCILIGGINDIIHGLDETSLQPLVSAFISAFHSKYPNKELIFFGINGCIRSNSQNASLHYNCRTIGETVRYWFAFNGCRTYNIQNALFGYNADMYNADDLHPNSVGHGILRGFILAKLIGADNNFTRNKNISFTPNSSIPDMVVNSSSIKVVNNKVQFKIDVNCSLSYGSNSLGTFGQPLIVGPQDSFHFYTGNVDTDGKIRNVLVRPRTNGTNEIIVVSTANITDARITVFGDYDCE